MTTILVTKDDTGHLRAINGRHAKAYKRFKDEIEALVPGELMQLSYWLPRNPALTGYHFIILQAAYDAQEQFSDFTQFRQWVAIGAGHAVFLPGPQGKLVAVPKSISFDALDDHDFSLHHEAVVDFLRSPICTRFLWPAISDAAQAEMIEGILLECELERERIKAQRQAGRTE